MASLSLEHASNSSNDGEPGAILSVASHFATDVCILFDDNERHVAGAFSQALSGRGLRVCANPLVVVTCPVVVVVVSVSFLFSEAKRKEASFFFKRPNCSILPFFYTPNLLNDPSLLDVNDDAHERSLARHTLNELKTWAGLERPALTQTHEFIDDLASLVADLVARIDANFIVNRSTLGPVTNMASVDCAFLERVSSLLQSNSLFSLPPIIFSVHVRQHCERCSSWSWKNR